MTLRRLLPLLTLLVLLAAPFGRMAAAEAMPTAHHGVAAATPGHCHDVPPPAEDEPGRAIDCMLACAVMAPAEAPPAPRAPAAAAAPDRIALRDLPGISPEAEPPPPRRS